MKLLSFLSAIISSFSTLIAPDFSPLFLLWSDDLSFQIALRRAPFVSPQLLMCPLIVASVSVLLPVEEPAAFLSCMQVANRSLKIVVEIAFAAGADKMQFSLP